MQCHDIVNAFAHARLVDGPFGNHFAEQGNVRFNRYNESAKTTPRKAVRLSQRSVSNIEELIAALREELVESGAMLVLLDKQQKLIIHRRPEALLENAELMSTQIETLASARTTRQRLSREIAEHLGCPGSSSFRQLIAQSPAQHQWLLRALVAEINGILSDCQERWLQNKLLLGLPSAKGPLILTHDAIVVFGLN